MQLCSLIGTWDSVPMDHCSTQSQGVASASNNVGFLGLREFGHLGAIRHCWKHLQHPGQRGTMLHGDTVPRSKIASSEPTFMPVIKLIHVGISVLFQCNLLTAWIIELIILSNI